MKKSFVSFFFLSLSFAILASSASTERLSKRHRHHHHRHHRKGYSDKKLFVFGDSYADTGNWNRRSLSWKRPYGFTFPGIPAGRFSDGRVLTDIIAQFLEIRSPIPYVRRKMLPNAKVEYGMNFAYGGTGVFKTYVNQPNMTSQINFFNDVITREKTYNDTDIQSSIAIVSLVGNDYATLQLKDPPPPLEQEEELLTELTKSVVQQLELNLREIKRLGVGKVAVTTLPPLGCLPITTFLDGYKNCSNKANEAANFHNGLLLKTIKRLNRETPEQAFFILNLYDAFLFALQGHTSKAGVTLRDQLNTAVNTTVMSNLHKGQPLLICVDQLTIMYEMYPICDLRVLRCIALIVEDTYPNNIYISTGKVKHTNPLEQCCRGVNSSYDCGSMDGNEEKYTVCQNPKDAFFWDGVHLTQNGWHQIYLLLQRTLKRLL